MAGMTMVVHHPDGWYVVLMGRKLEYFAPGSNVAEDVTALDQLPYTVAHHLLDQGYITAD